MAKLHKRREKIGQLVIERDFLVCRVEYTKRSPPTLKTRLPVQSERAVRSSQQSVLATAGPSCDLVPNEAKLIQSL